MTNQEKSQRAWRLLDSGNFPDAQKLFLEILTRDANHPRALHGIGRLALIGGKHDIAADALARCVRADPKEPEAHFHLAIAQQALGRIDDAIRSLRAAITLQPNVSRYHAALGTLLDQRGQLPPAIAELRRAVDLDPTDAMAHVNLSAALIKLDDFPSAAIHARRALEINGKLALAHVNLATCLEFQGDRNTALAHLQTAATLEPANPDIRFALSQLLLATGDYTAGWREYEWRFHTREDATEAPKFSTPAWDGSGLAGKTLLVHTEQGFGDTIQFARYLPVLAKRGISIVLRCQPALGTLMKSLKGVGAVITGKEAIPRFDAHVPLLGLARVLGTTTETIPRDVPYLFADEENVSEWSARLESIAPRRQGRRIGLCWSGNPIQARDRYRSLDPALLAPLASLANIQWFSLQKDRRSSQPPFSLHDLTGELRDFSDTAALMMNLDLVISVDTAVCHLAGALARPVWTLLYSAADYRYAGGGDSSVWYPTMRLFRQPALFDWKSVTEQVASALASWPVKTLSSP